MNENIDVVKKGVVVDLGIETLPDKQKKLDALLDLRDQKEEEMKKLKDEIFNLQEEIISTQN